MAFPNEEDRRSFSKYYTPTVEIKDYNVIIDGEPFYEIPIKNKEENYKAITKLNRNDLLRTGNEFNFDYFSENCKIIAIDLSKQKSDLKNQQINFIGRLEQNATTFFIVKEKETNGLKFLQNSLIIVQKMELQKIINILDHKDEDDPRFETRKWYIANDHNNRNYSQGDDVRSIKFDTGIVRPSLCDYSDAYILVTGNIKVQNGNDATSVAIKDCHSFTRAYFKLNNEQADTADNLYLTMNLYNMLEYRDNYAYSTGSLYQYKRPEPRDANGNVVDLAPTLSSFKYQSGLVQKQLIAPNSENVPVNKDPNLANAHRIWKNIKTAVPLKYISNFFRNLELPLINTKLYMELNWTKCSVLCNQDQNSIFQITKGELYIPVVTLNTENNNKLSE